MNRWVDWFNNTVEWLNNNAALSEWALLLVAAVTAGIAVWQIFAARHAQEDQARPYVVAGIRRVAHGVVELYVRNLGSTAAHGVTMKMTPEPTSVSDSKFFKLFDKIPTLVPRDEWSTVWEVRASDRFKQSNVASRFEVSIDYTAARGNKKAYPYRDLYVIDWEVHRSTTYVERKDIHHVAKELEKSRRALEEISKATGTDRLEQHTLVEAGDVLAQSARADAPAAPVVASLWSALPVARIISLCQRTLGRR